MRSGTKCYPDKTVFLLLIGRSSKGLTGLERRGRNRAKEREKTMVTRTCPLSPTIMIAVTEPHHTSYINHHTSRRTSSVLHHTSSLLPSSLKLSLSICIFPKIFVPLHPKNRPIPTKRVSFTIYHPICSHCIMLISRLLSAQDLPPVPSPKQKLTTGVSVEYVHKCKKLD